MTTSLPTVQEYIVLCLKIRHWLRRRVCALWVVLLRKVVALLAANRFLRLSWHSVSSDVATEQIKYFAEADGIVAPFNSNTIDDAVRAMRVVDASR